MQVNKQISLQIDQQKALSFFLNLCITLQHRKFLHVSIHKGIFITGERKSNNTA
jgi:hypothetical protein